VIAILTATQVTRLGELAESLGVDGERMLHRVIDAGLAAIVARGTDRVGRTLRAVARNTGVSVTSMRGHGRSPKVVRARHEAMRRLRYDVGMSLPEIGRAMCRDHTTVLAALRKLETAEEARRDAAE